MKLQIKKNVGAASLLFDVEVDSHIALFKETSFIFDLPEKCGNCESTNLKMSYSTPLDYEYGEVRCLDCNHRLTFGTRKADHYMYAKGWEPPYQGGEQSQSVPNPSPAKAVAATRPAQAPQRKPVVLTKPSVAATPQVQRPPTGFKLPSAAPQRVVPQAPAKAAAPAQVKPQAPTASSATDTISKLKQKFGAPPAAKTATVYNAAEVSEEAPQEETPGSEFAEFEQAEE